MAVRRRYILNKETGFNVMVNLYIIRYLYSHLDKAPGFMDYSGKRKKSIDLYSNILKMSRQRVGRIFNGEKFEISAGERTHLSTLFGITEKHFESKGEIITIGMLTEQDWKCMFKYKYGVRYDIHLSNKGVQERTMRVDEVLKSISKGNAVERLYKPNTPIFNIYYYFRNGVKYSAISKLTEFLSLLSKFSLSDWKDIEDDLEQLEHYKKILDNHSDYLQAVISYKKYKRLS